jgi:hypothetical protein
MNRIIDRLTSWLENNARTVRERELEKYFSQATDTADLENRMRIVERRGAF